MAFGPCVRFKFPSNWVVVAFNTTYKIGLGIEGKSSVDARAPSYTEAFKISNGAYALDIVSLKEDA